MAKKLTLATARRLAKQEFGTSTGLRTCSGDAFGRYEMNFMNLQITIMPDLWGGTDRIRIEACFLGGYKRIYQLHDPVTLAEDFDAEEAFNRQEKQDRLREWVETLGAAKCHEMVDGFAKIRRLPR